jgi:tetratricopeptide (TPR) repeat protein
MKIKSILAVLAFFLLLFPVKAQEPGELVQQANEAYISGDYLLAAELYLQVTQKGLAAPELYYNLGNSYFRGNQIANAILYYERALRLKPNDENIRHNLQVANSRIVDIIEPVPVLFYQRWWKNFLLLQPIDGWANISIVSIILFLASLSVYFFSRVIILRKISFASALFFLLLAMASLSAARIQYRNTYQIQEAVVFTPRVAAKSAPGQISPDIFVIHEGSKVRITSELGDWYEIRLANGNVGWIRNNAVEII